MGNSPSRNSNIQPSISNSPNSNQQLIAPTDEPTTNEPNDPDDSRLSYYHNTATQEKQPLINNPPTQHISRNIDIPRSKHTRQHYQHTYSHSSIDTHHVSRNNSHGNSNHHSHSKQTPPYNQLDLDIDISMAKAFGDYTLSNGSHPTTSTTTTSIVSCSSTSSAASVSSSSSISSSNSSTTSTRNPFNNSNNKPPFSSSLDNGIAATNCLKNSLTQTTTHNQHAVNHVVSTAVSISPTAIPNVRSSDKKVFLKRYPSDKNSSDGIDIDDIIEKLLKIGETRSYNSRNFPFRSWEIQLICYTARELFLNQPSLLKLQAPIKIVGDVHGQFTDFLRILKLSGTPNNTNYLFLGDYVDRGKQSLETILLLFCYKIKYRENFFMLRGNHESANVTKMYGFYDECKRRKNTKVWKMFIDVFNTLPFAATIQDKIFCIHGGISPNLKDLKQIENIKRPTDIPDSGLITDLLWSDPDTQVVSWAENDRGVSYTFGKKIVMDFCSKFNFDLIVRGHMVVEDGYEFFAKKKLVTIFSAPNYCGEFQNWGAVMSVTTGMMCSFELLKPHLLNK
ncbi:hypothetical protein TBLA_0B05260 [Henningerozyma blattae CBS 6284]|uniref:Serine/threonine-protein phosphatase n=1 Tax=Henningerozyma blattae (strain ATCC 34711 / CBS 6284 / DSM 70876 / NBRC 10599 / NRRL Y-10934 / UCD 77-7) TaxID=1071380 RepID=I2GZ06_HENB6|nr:hypothetical protein TBLA_0B05260 [Tetrapisispora blattae CBS 6284]CCH59358.1 hypothetical protein TBLA_0B05260 [Tetrapisispora blattae CBS 6284]